jgi:hypothetical protein
MKALYTMTYVGRDGHGGGAFYIGEGTIAGADVGGGRYQGNYTERDGRLYLEVTMTMTIGGPLVTGQVIPAGTQLPMTADWPANFSGSPQRIMLAGHPVDVIFDKVGDIS